MKKMFSLIAALFLSYASFALLPISGTLGACVGSSSYLTDSSGGGTWSSSNTAVATVGTTGWVYGVSAGSTTISYVSGGMISTAVFVVSPAPATITGAGHLCQGSSVTLSDATSGGTWISDATWIATISVSTGELTGVTGTVTGNTVTVHYIMGVGCETNWVDTIYITNTGTITGDSSLCMGSTDNLTETLTGGVWSSSNTSIATIGTGGLVTPVSTGVVTMSYTVTGVCGTASALHYMAITSGTIPGTISGATTVYVTGGAYLSETTSGGTWSSSNTAVATINTSGFVTGVAPGTVTISYEVTGCSGTDYATYVMTVTPLDEISGYVKFAGGFSGSVKVWLITFNTGTLMLEAQDSFSTICSGDSVYYQFLNPGTDSFRIKASTADSLVGTGFIPTYHTSSFYWHDANVLYHTAGTVDAYQDINMATGTVTSGPGFISGNVTTGANRATSGAAPAVGLLMVAEQAGSPVHQVLTDASGNYSFSNLGYGTYSVHPEAINYLSTDYTSITLSSTTPTVSATNFIQHTISHTITPGTTAVATVNGTASSIEAFPNPTSGKLTIQWNETSAQAGTVTISDITGHEISRTSINMNQGTGVHQLDLSGISNGLYIISVKTGDINYNNKIQVQH